MRPQPPTNYGDGCGRCLGAAKTGDASCVVHASEEEALWIREWTDLHGMDYRYRYLFQTDALFEMEV